MAKVVKVKAWVLVDEFGRLWCNVLGYYPIATKRKYIEGVKNTKVISCVLTYTADISCGFTYTPKIGGRK